MDHVIPARHRPMETGEILDSAFTLYLENLSLFLGTLAVLLIPQAIIDIILPSLSLLSFLTHTFALAALILVIAARYDGREIAIGAAYSAVGTTTFLMLLLAEIIYGIMVVVGLIILIVPGVYLAVRFVFLAPSVVLERKDIGAALGRSSQLVEGEWWRVFRVGLLVLLLVFIVQGVLGIVLSYSLTPRVSNSVGVLLRLLVDPFVYSALVILYYDLRVRKGESADLALQP